MIRRDLARQRGGNTALQEAEHLLEAGNLQAAERKLNEAAQAFIASADEYRAGKSYKRAAVLMCSAGDVYSEIGDSTHAISAYKTAADDLLSAAEEHLLWDDPAEAKRGAALAITACMVYIMVGEEATAFLKARQFSSAHASKLSFTDVVRVTQIPQQFEVALQNLDIGTFSTAERAATSELKTALGRDADSFYKYIERGLEMMREIFRSKIKIPSITSHIEIPIDLTFKDKFDVSVVISNEGDGKAFGMTTEWTVDPDLKVVSGETRQTVGDLDAGQSITLKLGLKAAQELTGVKEYSIMVKGIYRDQLNTEYSLQAGPAKIILRDFRESEKIMHDRDVSEGRIGLLRSTITGSILEHDPLERVVEGIERVLEGVAADVSAGKIGAAKAKIATVNELIDAMDALLGDESLISSVQEARKARMKDQIMNLLQDINTKIDDALQAIRTDVQGMVETSRQQLKDIEEKRAKVHGSLNEVKGALSDIEFNLEAIHKGLPDASSTSDPNEASQRTKTRTALMQEIEKIKETQAKLMEILGHEYLSARPIPETPEKVKVALDSLEKIKARITQIITDTKDKF